MVLENFCKILKNITFNSFIKLGCQNKMGIFYLKSNT